MNYLSICAIARNETDYLVEWVAFNKCVKVDHIYIYDNDSKIPVVDTLRRYIDEGYVSVFPWPGEAQQMVCYNDFIRNHGHETLWCAMIDCDEFLVPKTADTVSETLVEYEPYGGRAVSWRIFGSGGHRTKPDGLTIENYTLAMPRDDYENTHIKSIIQPAKTLRDKYNPHAFIYKDGFYAVSEDHSRVENAWCRNLANQVQLNHYFTRSFEEFETKVKRGRADTTRYEGRKITDFERFDLPSKELDERALRFVERTKKELERIR